MARNPLLPRAQGPIVGNQPPTTEYRTFFEQLAQAVIDAGGTAADVAELAARVAALEAAGTISFNTSPGSIQVSGGPETFIISLRGDEVAPGVTYYYGTGPTGEKGWFAVADTLAVEADELTKSVGADGVTTLGLADVADAGGGTLQKTDFDAKGRKTGTSDATTDDLPEGSTNLYFTDERAQDAVGAAVDGTGDVPLSYNDATGAISAALSSDVQASLDLADTAVQPGDFSAALVTLSGNQSIPDGTGTMLSFGAEAYDAGGYFDAGTPTRLAVPADGVYVASASAVFASNATGYRQLQLFKNGASFVGRPLSLQPAVSGIATGINCDSAPTYCTAGDYFEVQVTQTSGGALNVLQNNATWFAIRRLATT